MGLWCQGNLRSTISNIAVAILLGIVIVAGVAAVYEFGIQGAGVGSTSHSVSTVTETYTLPCPSSFENQTSSETSTSVNSLPDFGSLFGNFSALTIELYGNGSTGNSLTTSSFSVLNRSSYVSSSGRQNDYEVNVTTVAIEPNVEEEYSENFSTTVVTPGNHTNRESIVAYFSSNGSEISTTGVGGSSSGSGPDLTDLLYFYPLVTQNYSASGLSVINKTTITVGSARMHVTNYEYPALMQTSVQEGCNGEPSITTRTTIYNWTVQEGVAPGTNFSLVTQYQQHYSVSSNSTSPSSSSEFSLNWIVTSFTVS
jgi:hypothetical protein